MIRRLLGVVLASVMTVGTAVSGRAAVCQMMGHCGECPAFSVTLAFVGASPDCPRMTPAAPAIDRYRVALLPAFLPPPALTVAVVATPMKAMRISPRALVVPDASPPGGLTLRI